VNGYTRTRVHFEHTCRLRSKEDERPGQGEGCGECARVLWHTLCQQSGNEWPGPGQGCGKCVWVLVLYRYWYTTS